MTGPTWGYRDIDIQFRRNKPQNLLEIAQIIQMLADLLSKESRLKMLPDVDNPRDELDKLRDEQQKEMSSFGASGYEMLAKALQTAQEPTPAAGEPKEAVNE
ncbi:MAG: phage portal protein [Dysosmobacter sp.]